MSLCEVPGCGRPVADAPVCGTCADQAAEALRAVAGDGRLQGLDADLEVTFTRQARIGDGGRRGSVTPLPWHPGAAESIAEVRAVLVGWCRVLHGDHPDADGAWPADTLADMAVWLCARVEALRHHPGGSEAIGEIVDVVARAVRVVDRPPERWYAGVCGAPAEGGHCEVDLYARADAAMIACPVCGTQWDVAERRRWLLDLAEDVLAYPVMIAQALSNLGTPVTPVMITRWVQAGRLIDHGRDGAGHRLYRLGDVIDLAHEHARRQNDRRAGRSAVP